MSILLAAFHTMDPVSIGMTCVKLNPESMMSMHSGWVSVLGPKRSPWGIKDAAGWISACRISR